MSSINFPLYLRNTLIVMFLSVGGMVLSKPRWWRMGLRVFSGAGGGRYLPLYSQR